MNEKKPAMPQEIADEQLEDVTGGKTWRLQDGDLYLYVGGDTEKDWNNSYRCPKCLSNVESVLFSYFCPRCGEEWLTSSKLLVNTDSGVWKKYVPSK